MSAKICLVTGVSSGIGRATALELLRAGHTVYGAARRVRRMDDIRAAGGHVLEMDARNAEDLDRVVATVLDEQQRIDVLVNNAGTVLHGAVEDVPLAADRRDVDDRAGPLLAHVRQDELDQPGRCGHFPVLEVPGVFVADELRASFAGVTV
ncbi:SDR family NAD(P)-dependent oxidoreductase [Streptomyces sp. x-80]|uniref:SDR family NAD(P)-dependent oxidoreductase n=1 Tax=Streptomyces sp. x-80 TaxID=2789282 RepID=UPI00397F6DC7